jgi:hypothetical protein
MDPANIMNPGKIIDLDDVEDGECECRDRK